MKKALLLLFISLYVLKVNAQKIELSVSANSGLFSFGGNSAKSSTFINASDVASQSGYTNNPYGTKNGLGYGLSVNAKNVMAKHLLLGLDVGYEAMNSKIDITGINSFGAGGSSNLPATGVTKLNTQFLNLHPNIGFRFGETITTFDLTAGIDFGIILKSEEKGEAITATGFTVNTNRDRKNLKTDIRPRLQLAANYQKFGIYAGYSYGLSNYMESITGGGTWEVSSKVVRFGLSYRIK